MKISRTETWLLDTFWMPNSASGTISTKAEARRRPVRGHAGQNGEYDQKERDNDGAHRPKVAECRPSVKSRSSLKHSTENRDLSLESRQGP